MKEILQYNTNKELIKKWNAINIASKTLNIPARSISACCHYNEINNSNKIYRNYIWKFALKEERKNWERRFLYENLERKFFCKKEERIHLYGLLVTTK